MEAQEVQELRWVYYAGEDVYYDGDVEDEEEDLEEQWWEEDLDEGYVSSGSSTLCTDDQRGFW